MAFPLSKERMQAVLLDLQEAIQLWDIDGQLTYSNQAADALFGTGDDDGMHVGNSAGSYFHDDGRPMLPQELPSARILSTRQPINRLLIQKVGPRGKRLWIWISGQPLFSADGALDGAVTTASDVTDLVEQEQRLRQLAHHDALTQLPNRVLLAERMRLTLARSQRTGEMVAVCMLDLDGFKLVNDTLGHKAGDQLLREVAQRLLDCLRADDTASRLGGDEFALLISGISKMSECEQALSRLIAALAKPYHVGGQTARISASIGVTLFPDDGSDPDILLRHADQAMYQAKLSGKNRFKFFDLGQDQRNQANQGALRKIAKAIGAGQFQLFYQPIVDCRHGRIEGAEALIRWNHPILGMLAPSEFLPLIEQDDLVVELGEWVIQEALRQMVIWHKSGLDMKVSVNIAARQLHRPDFAARLRQLLDQQPLDLAHRLEIEIVESLALEDVNTVSDTIRECHKMGVIVALDDFGTGYSSLVHLKRLAADVLKIDQTFVLDMLADPENLAIVEGVVGLAAAFKRKVVAEGVESIDHILLLLELGCDAMQGYGLARPMSAEKFLDWAQSFVPDPRWGLAAAARPSRDYFELLLAEANHRIWVDQVIAHVRGREEPVIAIEFNDHKCRFGDWYYHEAFQRLHGIAEFRALETVHSNIHRMAERLCRVPDDQPGERARLEEELLGEHQKMVGLLRRLRNRLATENTGGARRPPYQKTSGEEQNGRT
ncbi:MAG: EAL domain-containing protein [Nitrosomonadales bacterium]|nr:EAL domain-containing protein [Nitrosomonadales bacterium]